MKDIVWFAGILVMFSGFAVHQLWTSDSRVAKSLADLDQTVPAPLTADVEAWLRPALARRDRWIGLGLTFGALISGYTARHGLDDVPWYWVTLALGITAGTTVGTLVAGYRADPRPTSRLRASTAVIRRWGDFADGRELRSLQLATPTPIVAMGLAGMITASGRPGLGLRTLMFSAIATVVVVASIWVMTTLVARPAASSTPEDLLWREALLKNTIGPLPRKASGVGWFSGFVAWTLALSGLFCLYCLGAVWFAHRPVARGRTACPVNASGASPW